MKNIIYALSNVMNNIRFKKKMLIVYIFVGILPILFFSLFSLYRITNTMLNSETEQLINENNRSKNALFQLTFVSNIVISDLGTKSKLKEILQSDYESVEESKGVLRSYDDIRNFEKNYPEFSSIKIYHENTSIPSYLEFMETTPEIRSKDWYQNAVNSYGQNIWFYDDSIEKGCYLHVMKYISLSADQHFIVMINISNNYMNSKLKNNKFTTLLGLNYLTIVYSPSSSKIGSTYLYDVSTRSGASEVTWMNQDGEKVLFRSTNVLGVNSNEQFQVTTINDCYPYIMRIILSFIILLIIILLFPFIIILCFTNMMNFRINVVRTEMHKVTQNDLQIKNTVTGKDEFGELYQDIVSTILSIQKLNTKIYENQLRQKELENEQNKIQFESLSNQINPHFLFNSLESIRMQAAIDGQNELARIIGNLGKLLRYALDNRNKTVTLSHELTYLHAYFEIQRFRFGEKLNYQINIDPNLDLENIYLLPLMIQPFVENVFSHAKITVAQNSLIRITIMRRNDQLFINIQDNGVGIATNKLQEINEYLSDPDKYQGNSIGIQNVNKRIRLFYGADYGISIESSENDGTIVSIRIPIRKEFSYESTIY